MTSNYLKTKNIEEIASIYELLMSKPSEFVKDELRTFQNADDDVFFIDWLKQTLITDLLMPIEFTAVFCQKYAQIYILFKKEHEICFECEERFIKSYITEFDGNSYCLGCFEQLID